MSNSLSFSPLASFNSVNKPGLNLINGNCTRGKIQWIKDVTYSSKICGREGHDSDKETKVRSIVCQNCDGNGAVSCSQCKGTGVNYVDHFNGRFQSWWIMLVVQVKKDMLCGDCNGAGFLGGFMSTFDE